MQKDYADVCKHISNNLGQLRKGIPETMRAFSAMAQAATRNGALDARTKELIALALGVAAHCDGCIGFHAEALVKSLASAARRSRRRSDWRSIWAEDRP
ncbi:AhpD family alkylhydroperoxidase [Bradyrhizobium sp. USDA 4452]